MKNLLFTFLIFSPYFIFAQFGGATNGNPSSIEWKEISNESARIIFPDGLEKRAGRVADVIDYLNKNNRKSIGKPKGKINIILQNQLTRANGFVNAGPFRSEFFTTAPQRTFAGTQDWLDLLAIHEYRHVMQFQFSKQGVTKFGAKLFGDEVWTSMNLLSIPLWFAEGDAVMQETLLSEGGRGRSGSFLAEYRAMHEAGVKYPYEKIRNRSFKSVIPNRYRMGYLFSEYGRNKYGNTLWRDVSQDAVRYKGLFWSFSQSLKRKTGKNVRNFYQIMMDSIYQQWDNENDLIDWKQVQEQLVVQPISKKRVTDYSYPKFMGKQILAIRSGRDRIPQFKTIDKNKKEHKLFDLGYHDNYFNYRNDKMVWTQTESDIRWGNKMYSIVYLYDFKTEEKRKLTSKTKFFSPDINESGTKIVVVSSNEMMEYRIQTLDTKSGDVIDIVPNPNNILFSSPKWKDDRTIIVIAQQNQRNALVEVDIQTGLISPIVDYTHNLIQNPVVKGDYVYFTGDFTKIRNIFAVSLSDKSVYQVTNSRVLANQCDVSSDGKSMLFSEQQMNGSEIKKIELISSEWKKISMMEPVDRYPELNNLAALEGNAILEKIPTHTYNVSPYRRWKGALNFHSWSPTAQKINQDKGLGLAIHSTNILSTTDLVISPMVNTNGETKIATKLVYNRFFPKVSLNYDLSKIKLKSNGADINLLGQYAYVGVDIPLIFSRGAWRRGLTLGASVGTQRYHALNENKYQSTGWDEISSTLHFYNYKSFAFKQLRPRFGQEFDIKYSTSSNEHLVTYGDIPFSIDAKFYFPGILRTHSFTLGGHYHEKGIYDFTKDGVRGLKAKFRDLRQIISADYAFPIAYPDLALGSILFIKRVRANIFYDYGTGITSSRLISDVKSMGIELNTDLGFLNLGSVFNLPLGVRISYIQEEQSYWTTEFIFLKTAF